MKNTLLVTLFTITLVFTGGCGLRSQNFEDISAQEAYELIQNDTDNNDFVILDVRTSEEYSEGHLIDAVSLDYQSEAFEIELNKLDKENTYLIYCKSGGRSGSAFELMKKSNFSTVYNMLGGITGWVENGFEVVK